MKQYVHDIIVDQIIAKLEQWVVPWKKSWKWGMPSNYVTGKEYRGINRLLLSMSDYKTNYYLTYNQIQKMWGKLKKGEKSTKILFWNVTDDPEDSTQKKYFSKYYHVFNLEQTNLIPLDFLEEEREVPEFIKARTILQQYRDRPVMKLWKNPCYNVDEDTIYIPKQEKFDSLHEYYWTLFHEMIHSTGNTKRLARDGVIQMNYFGSGTYSREELIAEIGATFLCNSCNILCDTLDNSVAYIQNWLKFLKENKREIITASNHAEKAVWYILNKAW